MTFHGFDSNCCKCTLKTLPCTCTCYPQKYMYIQPTSFVTSKHFSAKIVFDVNISCSQHVSTVPFAHRMAPALIHILSMPLQLPCTCTCHCLIQVVLSDLLHLFMHVHVARPNHETCKSPSRVILSHNIST